MANILLFRSSFQFTVALCAALYWEWFYLSIGYALVLIFSLFNHGFTHDFFKVTDRLIAVLMLVGVAWLNVVTEKMAPLLPAIGVALFYGLAKKTQRTWPHALCHMCATTMGVLTVVPLDEIQPA